MSFEVLHVKRLAITSRSTGQKSGEKVADNPCFKCVIFLISRILCSFSSFGIVNVQ